MPERTKVFVSYSHRDREWLERLQVHLKPLVQSGAIDLWDDTRIEAGDAWRTEIEQALAETRAAILLVSADFLASDFVAGSELPSLLAAVEDEGVRILPVILSASLFEETPQLNRFQAVNPPSRPLIGMARVDQEALLEKVARTVLRIVSPPPADAAGSEASDGGPAATAPPFTLAAEAPAPAADDDLARRVRAARELTRTFAPERYTYLGLIGISALVLLICAGKLFLSAPTGVSQQVTLVSSIFGAGGAAAFLSGRLLKLNARTMDFINERTGAVRNPA